MILNHSNGLLLMRHDNLGERSWRSDDCYKLIFSPIGKGIYQTNQRDVSIDTSHFMILNPGHEHRQVYVKEEKFLVEIKQPLLKDVADQLGINMREPEFALLSYKNAHLNKWISFIREYISLSEGPTLETKEFFIDNSITQLAILMLQYGPGVHHEELPHSNLPGNITNVVDAVRQSYDINWSLDDMAALSGLNKFQFAHTFKEETGLSPYSWLQLYRLVRSQHLLKQTKESILSIALTVGFKNVSSYNNLFKKVYGRTPTEFRLFYRKNS
ncbi:AraC family transcriptional regulator [Virgibacillus sp. C22-A2]|uniref:AraC family transcriptional regulator n=1 Tax=Virgibacillus tibetensis TaxID=3042313 RepID=A0ABU6KKL1_9BACI|nr:AraC family transcriptional regulator [Virgibacillus sp. C22-A2]